MSINIGRHLQPAQRHCTQHATSTRIAYTSPSTSRDHQHHTSTLRLPHALAVDPSTDLNSEYNKHKHGLWTRSIWEHSEDRIWVQAFIGSHLVAGHSLVKHATHLCFGTSQARRCEPQRAPTAPAPYFQALGPLPEGCSQGSTVMLASCWNTWWESRSSF